MNVNEVLETSPYLEVAVRHAYWKSAWLIERRSKKRPKAKVERAKVNRFAEVTDALGELGATSGRLLVVHSGYGALKPAGASPAEIVDGLLGLVGPKGTLAVPAIPYYEGEPTGSAYMTADVSDLVLEYDPATTPVFTGAIPSVVMKRSDAIRSRHPLNTMAAVGPLAEAMMAGNLDGDAPLPCGPNSSWKFCIDHDALVLGLGVDMAHSLTMIHTAEDCHADRWPQPGWYRKRRFLIIDGDDRREIVVRERLPRWAMHYAERTLHRDMLREGIMQRREVCGVTLYALESRRLFDYLSSRNHRGYPFYMLPATLPVVGRLTGAGSGR